MICPEPALCQAGDACAGRCKPTPATQSVQEHLAASYPQRWRFPGVPVGLKPCRSPYCECTAGQCTHPGCYDARDEAVPA